MKNKFLSLIICLLLAGPVIAQVPSISSFSQPSGNPGISISINGSNFNTTPANNIVFFGATKATVTSATSTVLTVTVPYGTTYQPVSVTDATTKLTGYSPVPFITKFTGHAASIVASDIDQNFDFPTGGSPFAVTLGDIDGDNKPDLIVANATGASISVLRNTATGSSIGASSFAPRVDFGTNNNPVSVTAGDLNGDGKIDLVVGYQMSNLISVYINNSVSGAPSFLAKVDLTAGGVPSAVAIADIDKDGKPEILTANFTSNTISVLRNNTSAGGTILFGSGIDFPTGVAPNFLAVSDLNGDAKPDVVVSNFSTKTVSVLQNNSSGTLSANSFLAKIDYTIAGSPTSVALGDVDLNGRVDIVVSNYSNTANIVSVLRNTLTANGNLTSGSFATPVNFNSGGEPVSVNFGDLDGDGNMDILASNYNSKTVTVLRNTSTIGSITASSMATKIDFAAGNTPNAIAVGDLDGDGKPDIVTANYADNTVSVLHNYNVNAVPGPVFAESTATISLGSFVNTDIMDTEWKQEAPPGYTIAPDNGTIINGAGTAGNKAGRFVYFSTLGSLTPTTVPVNGTLTFSAKGNGTIEVQIISTSNNSIQARKTFALNSAAFTDFGWNLPAIYPQLECILAVIFNGDNASVQANGQFKKNFCLTLKQAGLTGSFKRYRADTTTLIGNRENGWYGYSDQEATAKKKYLQASPYARMRLQTDATQITMEYVRDFYDKKVSNTFPYSEVLYSKTFSSTGQIIAGPHGINISTKVNPGKTYTIYGLKTTNPVYVWLDAAQNPLGTPQSLVHGTTPGPDTCYQIVAPANAAKLGLLVQRISDTVNFSNPANDNYLAFTGTMIQEGAYGAALSEGGTIPSPFSAFTGTVASKISGPAIFINGKLYNYYNVESTDVAKRVQYVSDVLPPGMKTVEVMMPGEGTYSIGAVLIDPHIRRSGNYLRAVYLPSANTTVTPATTVAAGSVLFINDSILSGFNISNDSQNNVWMMKIKRDSTFGFTPDIFSEGYAGRLLHTDTKDSTLINSFARKLVSYGTNKFWFQVGVNDYANQVSMDQYYQEFNSLIDRIRALNSNAYFYIQSIGPIRYEGANSETRSDNGLAATGPATNDFRDIQRAIANAPNHAAFCEYVDFEGLFPSSLDNLADGIHPTDQGNALYAQGIKTNSTLLGTVLPVQALQFKRNDIRPFIQTVKYVSSVAATGGKAPYNFTLISGTIPAGLAFYTNGVIRGTATVNGTFPWIVQVKDANNTVVQKSFNLVVNPIPPVRVSPGIISDAQVGVPYSIALKGSRGYGDYTVSFSGTPVPGLTYNPATNLLTGTPTTAGTYNFVLTAIDHWGFTGNTSYSFKVGTTTPGPLVDNYVSLASVSAAGDLIINGQLHDTYTQRVFIYYDVYITQGSETLVASKQVIIDPGQLFGNPVNAGHVGYNGNFTVRMHNYGLSPSSSDGKNFAYITDTNIPLSGNANTGPVGAVITPTATVAANGDIYINSTVSGGPFTQNIYIYYNVYTQQGAGADYYINGKQVIILAGQSTGTPVFCGTTTNTGNFNIKLHNYGPSPSGSDGKTFVYTVDTAYPVNR